MITKATHAVILVPPWLAEDGTTTWELHDEPPRPGAKFTAARSDSTGGCPAGGPDDNPAILTEWAAGQIGHPVHLSPQSQVRMRRRNFGWRTVPMYYVFPGSLPGLWW